MKAINAMVTWNFEGSCFVVSHPDFNNASRDFTRSDGAVFDFWRKLSTEKRKTMVFVIFNTLVVRDGIDPKQAHEEFLKIDEYAKLISPDIPGAIE